MEVPGTTLVGLPDAVVRQSVDRVRAAIVNAGGTWPMRRMTIGLSPASMPKQGSGFDLALAVKTAITQVVKDQFKSGIQTFDASSDGVGIAPYHNFESKLTSDQKAKVDSILKGLKDGSIKTGAET